MFKSLLSKLRTKRSPLDPSDWIAEVPTPPPTPELREFIRTRFFGNDKAPPPASPAEEQARDFQVRHMSFDLKYRCGAEGRCSQGTFRCRFPECFTMRPIIKGAEVFGDRAAYEVEDVPSADLREVVLKARDDRLQECVDDLQRMVEERISSSKGEFGKPQHVPTEEAIGMMQWRAALLVNLREDEKAVSSLVNFMRLLHADVQVHAVVPATQWAFLHDLEVMFYARHCDDFPGFTPWKPDIVNDPMLLPRVVQEVAFCNKALLDHVAHQVFAKHVAAIINRGETSQKFNERFEEPMKTTGITDEVRYLRNTLLLTESRGQEVWQRYVALATIPPLRPRILDPKDPLAGTKLRLPDPAAEAGSSSASSSSAAVGEGEAVKTNTDGGKGESAQREGGFSNPVLELRNANSAVVDAVARSILCHHLAEVMKEHGDPELQDVVKRLKDLLAVARMGEQRLAMRRQELLEDMKRRQEIEASGSGSGSGGGGASSTSS